MDTLLNIKESELLEFITSDYAEWKGMSNGDSIEHFQKRSGLKLAACLIIACKEIDKDKSEITKKEALKVLKTIVDNIEISSIKGMCGTHGFYLSSFIDAWKSVCFRTNQEIINS